MTLCKHAVRAESLCGPGQPVMESQARLVATAEERRTNQVNGRNCSAELAHPKGAKNADSCELKRENTPDSETRARNPIWETKKAKGRNNSTHQRVRLRAARPPREATWTHEGGSCNMQVRSYVPSSHRTQTCTCECAHLKHTHEPLIMRGRAGQQQIN